MSIVTRESAAVHATVETHGAQPEAADGFDAIQVSQADRAWWAEHAPDPEGTGTLQQLSHLRQEHVEPWIEDQDCLGVHEVAATVLNDLRISLKFHKASSCRDLLFAPGYHLTADQVDARIARLGDVFKSPTGNPFVESLWALAEHWQGLMLAGGLGELAAYLLCEVADQAEELGCCDFDSFVREEALARMAD